ncbi:hypothetical protein N9N42_01795 [Flavobacteriaceae bacterium]|nr:hypothetical protein [Flavobacteriaceae bacterium]|tara:strand:+ start:396 stop:590 length:195 start_codon:yes stop_codon:yes gene_type:complete
MLAPLLWGCGSSGSKVERPVDTWVFRSVLDKHPRMITVALHNDLWVAYDAQTAALYKKKHGKVE